MILKTKTKIFNPLVSLGTNLKIVIFGLSLVSIVAYLVVVNHTNTLGIEIGQMQYKIKELEKQYRDLQSTATALQAMTRIEEISNTQLSMVKAESFEYVLPEAGAMAAVK